MAGRKATTAPLPSKTSVLLWSRRVPPWDQTVLLKSSRSTARSTPTHPEPSGETTLTDAPPPGSGEGEGGGAECAATVVVHGDLLGPWGGQQPSRRNVPLAMRISSGLRGCETAPMRRDLAAARSELTSLVGQPAEATEFSHEVNAALMKTLPFDGWCLVGCG